MNEHTLEFRVVMWEIKREDVHKLRLGRTEETAAVFNETEEQVLWEGV